MQITERGLVFDSSAVEGPLRVCSFTSLCRLSDGTLLASFRCGSAKDSADGNVVICQSTDDGATWSVISEGFESEFDGMRGEVRSAELAELDDGRLLAVLGWVDRSGGDGVLRDAETDTMPSLHLLLEYSTDGGRTWGGRRVLQRDAVLSGPVVHLPGRGWLVTSEFSHPGTPDRERCHGAYAHFTADGETFESRIDVVNEDPDLFYYDQRQKRCPRTGRPVALFWTYDNRAESDIEMHMAWCDPRSLTWETPRSLGLAGQIAMPIPLEDGRLLAFYVHRHEPGSLRLIASTDEGTTWDLEDELVVYSSVGPGEQGISDQTTYDEFWEAMGTWSFGHPTAVVLDDGSILLAYYAGADETCLSVHWARVTV
tara:strand:+ start:4346 stop:5455 length:1110 start_codon:yes stop_codon:yes gene_type:complete